MGIEKSVEEDVEPCKSNLKLAGVTEKLCEALMENDLIDIILKGSVDYKFCHGSADEIVSYQNIPNGYGNGYIPNLDHATTGIVCTLDFMEVFIGAMETFRNKIRSTSPLENLSKDNDDINKYCHEEKKDDEEQSHEPEKKAKKVKSDDPEKKAKKVKSDDPEKKAKKKKKREKKKNKNKKKINKKRVK